jgi:putative phage-type endonuclease
MSLTFYYDKDLPKVTPLKAEYLRNQVTTIKNIFQPEQKSKEWYEMRNEMLTASDWGTVLGENHYSNSNAVLLKKCGDDTFMTNAAMQWGNKYEAVAVLIYEHRNNKTILEFGCLRHPFISFLGASPDGITEDGIMLEIKCPTSRKITGIPPAYYWCQVQGQLEVCELDRCDFLECSLKEYGDENEYINDSFNGNNKLNKFGNEKGVVVELYNKVTKAFKYDYSPVCILDEELENWKVEIARKHVTDDIILSCFSYWYLEEVSCVPIYRNQEWFNTAKVKLELFWNDVIKYRALGIDKLREDILKEKSVKKEEKDVKRSAKKEEELKKKKKKTKDVIILDSIDKFYPQLNKKEELVNSTELTQSKELTQSSTDSSEDEEDYDKPFLTASTSLFSEEQTVTNVVNYDSDNEPNMVNISLFSD